MKRIGDMVTGTHRRWLAERNDLLCQLNGDDGHDRVLHCETTQREIAIGSAPPATRDDVVAKLVYIAQIVVEGATPNEELVAGTIAESRRLLGMGSLAEASVAIREAFDA